MNKKPNQSKNRTSGLSSSSGSALALIVGVAIGLAAYHFLIIGIVMDSRAGDLGWMTYSSEQGKMVPKNAHRWDLKYLETGSMD